jgi:cell wall assembly regulator SMI1
MTDVREGWDRLVAFHHEIGSPVPAYLNPPVTAARVEEVEVGLGFALHPDVVALFGCADGIDQERWRELDAAACEVAPLQEFLPLTVAAERERMLRGNAERSGVDGLWRTGWFPVLVMEADEAIVVDSASGQVWVVRWEAADVRPLGRDLAEHLRHNVALMRAQGVSWDAESGELALPDDPALFGYY